MAIVLQLNNAFKRYGQQELLDSASCSLPDDQKIGLIGRNGAGKSTLCRLLLGDEELDSGEIVRSKKLRLGYLRQHDPFHAGETVLEFLLRDTSQPEWRCGEIAWKFQLDEAVLQGPVHALSGGWQTRVKLAALLLHDPNLLILDEPTNFLDLRTQLLLESFLKSFRGGCLVVSHDRAFLNRTCSSTLELSRGKLTMFPGNVDSYMENLTERQEHVRRVNQATLAKRKQLETFINKNRANANTASQARNKAKQLDRLEVLETVTDEAKVMFSFPSLTPRQGTAIRAVDLTIGYPEHTVAKDIRIEINHGSRVGLVGDNGQGKTTFLRTICQSLETLGGELKLGYGCQFGVYAQHVYTTLPPNETVLEYLENEAIANTTNQQIKAVAGSFLFRGEGIEKKIKVLSGGERARLVMAGLLLNQHNILILDEPGNHLDVETVDALIDALKRYEGAVIFTSHDRYFMEQLATDVVEVREQHVVLYPASYKDYLRRVEEEIEEGLRSENSANAKGDTVSNAGLNSVKSRSGKEEHSVRKKLKSMERKIEKLDQDKKTLSVRLANVQTMEDAKPLQDQHAAAIAEIIQLEEEWFELSSSLGE